MAVQGVYCELVSEFPDNREEYREFFNIGRRFRALDAYLSCRNSGLRVHGQCEP